MGFNGTANGSLPADGNIQIAFDRLLSPASATRQAISLRDGVGNFLEPVVTYDPVLRVVSLAAPTQGTSAWLTVGATYYVVMNVAAANDTIGNTGPKAIDGATLDKQVVESFLAAAPVGATPSEDRLIDPCNDVMPIFQNWCSNTACHGTPPGDGTFPREGLALDSPIGLLNTAIGRASQESNTGPLASLDNPPGKQFGIDMPIIDPGNPGNSWLMYKLLLAPGATATAQTPLSCGGTAKTPLPTGVSQATKANPDAPTVAISASDRAILSELVIGNQMPYPPNPPLAIDELERIRAWIAAGAKVVQCPNCPGP